MFKINKVQDLLDLNWATLRCQLVPLDQNYSIAGPIESVNVSQSKGQFLIVAKAPEKIYVAAIDEFLN